MGSGANTANILANNFLIQPKYLIGTNVASNLVNPYYQGTSNTANGFQANSTGTFTPALAAQLAANTGDSGFYPVDMAYYGNLAAGIYIDLVYECIMFSNVDSNIQMASFIGNSATDQLYTSVDSTLETIELKANLPIRHEINTSFTGIGGSFDYAGVMLRNMNGTSNVIFSTGRISISKSK